MIESPRPLRPSLLARAGLVLFLLAGALHAFAPTVRAAQETVPAQPAAQPEKPAPVPGYSSPRETMETFLRNALAWREHGEQDALVGAMRALDLRSYPAADRDYVGQQAVSRLLKLIDKLGRIDPAGLPSGTDVPESGTHSQTISRADRPEVAIEIVFTRVAEGQWVIADSTLKRLGEWTDQYAAVQPLIVAGESTGFHEWVRSKIPEALKRRVAFLEAWQWIGLALFVLIGLLAQRVVSYFFARTVAHVSQSERVSLDTKLLGRVALPLALLATSVAFFAGLPLLDLEPGAYHTVNLLANIGLTIAVVWTAYRVVDVLAWVMAEKAARTETRFDDMLVPLVRRTLKVVVLVVGIVLIVTRMDRDLWSLVAGLSIGSLAVGFAAKESIENLFGTFTVLMDKPFQLGDVILVDGIEGSVEDVGFRSTRLRTGEDALITVPNSRFIAAAVDNRGVRRYRRVRTILQLTYDTPPERIDAFCEGIRELVRRHPYTRKSDYHAWVHDFGASSIDVQLTVFLEVADWPTESRERHRLLLDILRLAERAEVSFAFPTQTIHWERAPARVPRPDTVPESPASMGDGRRLGAEVAEGSVGHYGGERPGPVRFDTEDPDDAGPGKLARAPLTP